VGLRPLLVLATFAELLSNDRPFVAHRRPVARADVRQPERAALGGDFTRPPTGRTRSSPSCWPSPATGPSSPQPALGDSIDYFDPASPARPTRATGWAPTAKGRDMLARLLYGFRVSIWFALALTSPAR
jgi:microcin C transport system permease protein